MPRTLKPYCGITIALAVAVTAGVAQPPPDDPLATVSDLYAFVAPDAPDAVTLIACYEPRDPSGGPLFPTFDPTALYALHIDNDGDCLVDVTYEFTFTSNIRFTFSPLFAVGTITDLDGFGPNYEQLYSVTRVDGTGTTVLGSDLRIPPTLVGPSTTPDYDALVSQAIVDLAGSHFFCGPRDVAFWMDAALFDIFSIRPGLPGTMGGGIDLRGGFNGLAICLQVPIAELTQDGSVPDDPTDPDAVLGFWATTSRPEQTEIGDGDPIHSGPFVQVTRRGMPLVDELYVGLGQKELYRGTAPDTDLQFEDRFEGSEIAELLASELGLAVPPTPRADLVEVYLEGLPNINQVPGQACDLLRLNVAIPPTGSPDPLGVLGGDLAGFPNGRRPVDDVMDVTLRLAAGALVPGFESSSTIGDGVDGNDLEFSSEFPYLPSPHSGFEHSHHIADSTAVSIEDVYTESASPLGWLLNAPNPSGSGTRVVFHIKERTPVALSFYDALGRRLDQTGWDELDAGTHEFVPNTEAWPAGVYFYELRAGARTLTRRMTLLD